MNGLHLLSIDISQVMDQSTPIGERLISGLQTMGLGLGIVFLALILIWGACELLHYVLHKKEADSAEPVLEQSVPAPAPAPVQDNGELIAVITAAIAAVLDQPTNSFRVVSFRRTSEVGTPWNNGRTE